MNRSTIKRSQDPHRMRDTDCSNSEQNILKEETVCERIKKEMDGYTDTTDSDRLLFNLEAIFETYLTSGRANQLWSLRFYLHKKSTGCDSKPRRNNKTKRKL